MLEIEHKKYIFTQSLEGAKGMVGVKPQPKPLALRAKGYPSFNIKSVLTIKT
jgi:hypothetical protein